MGRERDKQTADGRLAATWRRYTEPWKSSLGQLALATALLGLLSFAAISTWGRFGDQILASEKYIVTAENIRIPKLPPWIRTELKSEAIVSGSLENLNVQQEDLSPRVAAAFKMHPWVLEVRRVSKRYPAKVIVDLTYRRPIAMVEVDNMFDVEKGLYPVDPEGTLLPTADFTAEEASRFPRIIAAEATPIGAPGTAWGDPRVHGAAQIAKLLEKSWKRLKLVSINANQDHRNNQSSSSVVFELKTAQTTILWGRGPGEEERGEPRAERKVQRLLGFVAKHGSLDTLSPGEVIDLRQSDKLAVASREDLDLQ